MRDISGSAAVVTGGGGAIGAVAAQTLAELGADVVVCGRSMDRLRRTAERSRRIQPFPMDVSAPEDWQELLSWIDETLSRPVTVLVTAAGTNHRGPFLSSTCEQWTQLWQTNVVGTMLGAQSVLPGMLDAGFGRIALVSSVGARIGLSERSAYAATKGAIEAFARSLAAEVGPAGVTVNCVAPGAMPTDLNRRWLDSRPDMRSQILGSVPMERFGEPAELAAAFRFLMESTYSQGSTVVVDGGWTAL